MSCFRVSTVVGGGADNKSLARPLSRRCSPYLSLDPGHPLYAKIPLQATSHPAGAKSRKLDNQPRRVDSPNPIAERNPDHSHFRCGAERTGELDFGSGNFHRAKHNVPGTGELFFPQFSRCQRSHTSVRFPGTSPVRWPTRPRSPDTATGTPRSGSPNRPSPPSTGHPSKLGSRETRLPETRACPDQVPGL